MTTNKINKLPQIISSMRQDGNVSAEGRKNNAVGNESEKSNTKSINTDDNQQIIIEKPRLILHFDINETILIGDEAGGDTVDDCFNKIISKSAFVKIPSDFTSYKSTSDILPVQWWDGTYIQDESITNEQRQAPNTPPPPLYTGFEWPKYTCPYYRTSFRKRAKQFTMLNQDGEIYHRLYEHLKLQIPTHEMTSEVSHAVVGHNDENHSDLPSSHPFFRMIPSFFHTLVKLQEEGRDYTLVLRTFGSDLEDIALAVTDFACGKHPLFPNFYEPKLVLDQKNLFKGRWRRSVGDSCIDDNDDIKTDSPVSSVYDLLPWKYDENVSNDVAIKAIASGDEQVMNIIHKSNFIGINDDYHYWDINNNAPWAAKPVWITESCENGRKKYHHIFFDDNIHNDANDSIVAVRKKIENKWVSLTGAETIGEHGRYLFRVPTVEVLLNNEWFYEKICNAEAIINNDNN